MKRLLILVIILTSFTVVCLGRSKSRNSPLKIVRLPAPRLTGQNSFEQVLAERRSVRRFTSRPLDFAQIGQLAWAAQGITEPKKGLRTAPSAGAIYPIKLYFAVEEGMFLYQPDGHSLEKISDLDIRSRLAQAALNQQVVADAACDVIIVGSVKKLAAKYGNKARRFMLLEAGHIAQNINLQAVSLELASVPIGAFDIRGVGRLCRIPTNHEPLYIISVGYPADKITLNINEEKTAVMDNTKVKKAVLIIASEKFRDEELLETRQALNDAAIETVIASSKTGVIKGMLGAETKATILVNELDVDDYNAIIFIGGLGAREYFSNRIALGIARKAAEKKKVLAAICIAPAILARAGVLDGIKATCFPSERMKLKKAGAVYTDTDVEKDGLIITGNGPKAATEFGKAVARTIKENIKPE